MKCFVFPFFMYSLGKRSTGTRLAGRSVLHFMFYITEFED